MQLESSFMQRLALRHPVIQAPMAGGGDTPELVAAVCEAGALGFIGAAYLTPSQLREVVREVQVRTSRPFGINLFAPLPVSNELSDPRLALERVTPFYVELGLTPPALSTISTVQPLPFDEQLAAALASGASASALPLGYCRRTQLTPSRHAACS